MNVDSKYHQISYEFSSTTTFITKLELLQFHIHWQIKIMSCYFPLYHHGEGY